VTIQFHPSAASQSDSVVYIIDDDQATCVTMTRLMQSVGILVKTFPEPKHFFVADLQDMPACLVMDVRLRGESGLTVQRRIRTEGFQIPVIFATCHGDIATSVSAMKAGAVDFLTKPFREQEMLDAVIRAIEIDREHMARDRQHIYMMRCYSGRVTWKTDG
jgi:FixJ family two-component response regulator